MVGDDRLRLRAGVSSNPQPDPGLYPVSRSSAVGDRVLRANEEVNEALQEAMAGSTARLVLDF